MRTAVASVLLVGQIAFAGGVAAQQSPPAAVLVEPATLRPLAKQAEYIGRVQALEKVELRARVQGFLGPRGFADGAEVEAGRVLFTIEAAPFEAAVASARAKAAAAVATLDNARQQLDRAKELQERNTLPQATLDQRVAEEARARADVLQAEAAVKKAEIELSYTEIRSPIAGRIGRAAVSPGNLVGPETGVLATVVAQTRVQVLFPITQRELLQHRTGAALPKIVVRAILADGRAMAETGTVDFIDVQADPRTDTVAARAVFDNPDRLLADGQTIRITIAQADPERVVTVSQQALATDQAGAYVFVVGEGNLVRRQPIRAGRQRDGLVEVLDGVKEGDRVIVQGQQRVRPGQPVEPKPMIRPAG